MNLISIHLGLTRDKMSMYSAAAFIVIEHFIEIYLYHRVSKRFYTVNYFTRYLFEENKNQT